VRDAAAVAEVYEGAFGTLDPKATQPGYATSSVISPSCR
jgi:hypothetical protein